MQSTLTPLAVAFIIIGQILVDQVNHGCIIGKKSPFQFGNEVNPQV
ncbi:hypothetical protein LBP_cg2065 [Lactiplantibacillus plantarum subsp. plantarum P-8]|nr:hypothetical protein LBP_cg2065 [Lactiplantibacillus plantarum subsp. plantarum P-8]